MKNSICEAARKLEQAAKEIKYHFEQYTSRWMTWEGTESKRYYDELTGISEKLKASCLVRPLSEWSEEDGDVVWWKFPVEEPSWIGTPLDDDWPGYHTHWTPHPEQPVFALLLEQDEA